MPERPVIVFHVPQPVDDDPKVGSRAHVTHMLDGFRRAGFDVEVVSGSSRERAVACRRVRAMVRQGRRFEFVYSEATTIPTALNDAHHLPVRPLLDIRFLRFMRRSGVPVGLFYPDVHWRFDFHRAAVPLLKRAVAAIFYRFDLLWYRFTLDAFFLPSLLMARSIPGWRRSSRVHALFPGGRVEPFGLSEQTGELRLFYVGSVTPPLYDVSDLLEAVVSVPGVHLTLCCPESERGLLPPDLPVDRVQVVHEHGDALRARYSECHVACLVYPSTDYRAFAMPVKLFEALGFGRPVLVSGGVVVDEFITTTGFGWIVEPGRLAELLKSLRDDPGLVAERHRAIVGSLGDHSWESRARQVAGVLSGPEAGQDSGWIGRLAPSRGR